MASSLQSNEMVLLFIIIIISSMPCVVERKLRAQARYAFQVEKRLHMAMHGFIAVDVAVTVFSFLFYIF